MNCSECTSPGDDPAHWQSRIVDEVITITHRCTLSTARSWHQTRMSRACTKHRCEHWHLTGYDSASFRVDDMPRRRVYGLQSASCRARARAQGEFPRVSRWLPTNVIVNYASSHDLDSFRRCGALHTTVYVSNKCRCVVTRSYSLPRAKSHRREVHKFCGQ